MAAQIFDNGQLVDVLQQLQMQTLSAARSQQVNAGEYIDTSLENLAPQQAADVSQKVLEKAQLSFVDRQTMELVGTLFEYLLADQHLPDSIKAPLSYLYIPLLKISIMDKDFFAQAEHPARLLLNSLAEAGGRWVGNDGTDQHEIYVSIKTTVFKLLEEFKTDVGIFTELLLKFNSYTYTLLRRQELMERRALEKVQGEDKLRETKLHVNQEMCRRIDTHELPSAVLLLLLQPWSDYMAFVLLRHGEKSAAWQRALEVIEQLIWSIEPKILADDKQQQIELHGPLIEALEQGFTTIGYEQGKGSKLIEALISLQQMALQSKKAEPAPILMRSKLESMAAEKAGDVMATDNSITAEEAQLIDKLCTIEFGAWIEFDNGKRMRVAWYNKKTQLFMLVDQQGSKVTLSLGLQLVRDMLSANAILIDGLTKPLFERALENIYQTHKHRNSKVGTV